MENIIEQINSRIAYLGLSKQSIADRIHKDLSTVKKQLSPSNNHITLEVLEEYAAALDGDIMLVTDEARAAVRESNVDGYRKEIVRLSEQVAILKEQIALKEARCQKLENKIDERDAAIQRKDLFIHEMFDRQK